MADSATASGAPRTSSGISRPRPSPPSSAAATAAPSQGAQAVRPAQSIKSVTPGLKSALRGSTTGASGHRSDTKLRQKVRFADPAVISVHAVPAYCTVYGKHPSLIVATRRGWKSVTQTLIPTQEKGHLSWHEGARVSMPTTDSTRRTENEPNLSLPISGTERNGSRMQNGQNSRLHLSLTVRSLSMIDRSF